MVSSQKNIDTKVITLSESPTLEEVQQVFANDMFATHAAGCAIVEASKGHAVCEMPLADIHRNAQGNIMGGAIFTLCDFALAIACNVGNGSPATSVDHSVSFMRVTKGSKLIAEANCDKPGSHLSFYTVTVTDDLGKEIARMSATCYNK